MNPPRVTVIILNYHGDAQLPRCIEHLARQDFTDYELVLIDNNPPDGAVSEVLESPPISEWLASGKARAISNPHNIGFAAGVNQGIRVAKGEYILTLNQDAYLDANYISTLASLLDADARIASVTGKLLREDAGGNRVIDSTGHEFYDDRVVINRGKGERDAGQYDEGEVFGVSAAAAMYRLSAIRQVEFEGQVFDEDFFAYLEDIDMDFRLRRAGYIAWYTPRASARHDLAGSGGRRGFGIRFRAHPNRDKIRIVHDSISLQFHDFAPMFRQEMWQFIRTLFTSPLLLLAHFALLWKWPRLLRKRRFVEKTAKVSFTEIYRQWVRKNRLSCSPASPKPGS